jgi:hypothetical protein
MCPLGTALCMTRTGMNRVDVFVSLQRGITRLKRFNLSKIYGTVAAAGAVGRGCFTLLRSQADVPGGNGTHIYICVVNAARQAVHVLSLSASEVTYVGDLGWPSDTEQHLERDLLCGSHTVYMLLGSTCFFPIMLLCPAEASDVKAAAA